jgi:hypothetical protein
MAAIESMTLLLSGQQSVCRRNVAMQTGTYNPSAAHRVYERRASHGNSIVTTTRKNDAPAPAHCRLTAGQPHQLPR